MMIFFSTLVYVAYFELKKGFVPQKVLYGAMSITFILNIGHSGLLGLKQIFLGFCLGFIPFFILYKMKGIQFGDALLMASVGVMGGVKLTLFSYLYSSIIGFFMALFIMFKNNQVLETFKNIGNILKPLLGKQKPLLDVSPTEVNPELTIPYGLAIVVGSYLAFFKVTGVI